MYITTGPGVLRSRSGAFYWEISRIHSIDKSDCADHSLGINSFLWLKLE